jgi:release factor glutamine methyltransferase
MTADPLVVARLRAAGCVFAEEEAELLTAAADSPAALVRLVDRRAEGEPLEQILGWAEFCGLRIAVEPGVFVPRRRSELMVREAAALAGPRPVVLDLCCGSGALGVALAAALGAIKLGPVELYAADVDSRAVHCARRNVADVGGEVFEGDLFDPLPQRLRGMIDLIVANGPYVPTGAIAFMPPEARIHEPTVALDGGADGLQILRRVSGEAGRWLAPGGSVLMEVSEGQAPDALAVVADAGLDARIVVADELEATVVIGTRVGSGGLARRD